MKIFALLLFIWATTVFLGSTYEYNSTSTTWAGTGTGSYSQNPQTTMTYLLNVKNASSVVNVLGVIPLPVPNSEWWNTLFRIITLRFSFITGDWMMFYWIVLAPLAFMGIGTMMTLLFGLIRGVLNWGT